MARAPLQVLVFPYRFAEGGALQFALFRRSDGAGDVWQAVSGGAEDDETPEAAARREMNEEAGIPRDADLTALEHRQLWESVSRKLKAKGVVAFWTREINSRDRVHYHLITASYVPPDDYKAMVANQFVDWKLVVDGLVEHPASWSLAQLRAMPSRNF